jgi:hypothetical protein
MPNEVKRVVADEFTSCAAFSLDNDLYKKCQAGCDGCRFDMGGDLAIWPGDTLILFDDNTVKLEKAVRS